MKFSLTDSIGKKIYAFIGATIIGFAVLLVASILLMHVFNMVGVIMRGERETSLKYIYGMTSFQKYLLAEEHKSSYQGKDRDTSYDDFVEHLNGTISRAKTFFELRETAKKEGLEEAARRTKKEFKTWNYEQTKSLVRMLAFFPETSRMNHLFDIVADIRDTSEQILVLSKEYREADNFDLRQRALIQITNLDKKNKELFDNYSVLIGEYSAWLLSLTTMALFLLVVILLLGNTLFGIKMTRSITIPLRVLTTSAERIAGGDLTQEEISIKSYDEIGILATAFNNMASYLKENQLKQKERDWLKTSKAELSDRMRGEQDLAALSRNIINYLCVRLDAKMGALYLARDNNLLQLAGSYAYTKIKNPSDQFKFGEGLIGQAALAKESIVISDVPDDYIKITSGLGEAVPRNIIVMPFLREDKVKGVLELGAFREFKDIQMDFLNHAVEGIAVAIDSCESYTRTQALLEATQKQAEELQAQQDKLQKTNQELEEQTVALKESEEKLKNQHEELQNMNEELEERTQLLEEQKDDIKKKNIGLEEAQKLIEEKARDLAQASKYKSEFLTNMSHELRTPLNSILILSKLLSENKSGGLKEKEIEFAQTIHGAGSDLLKLINEALDLSKVEAGKMEINFEDMEIAVFCDTMRRNFMPLAEERRLTFTIEREGGLPSHFRSDTQKVEQIVKNMLSNAFKFTEKGGITLNIFRPDSAIDLSYSGVANQKVMAISVSDTGIGIPEDKQKLIFEAFQQADGTTSRKYGGTGLGLSISKEMARILGGEIRLESAAGKGSVFTLYLPETPPEGKTGADSLKSPAPAPAKNAAATTPAGVMKKARAGRQTEMESVRDDRKTITSDDKLVLIIEDDSKFAKILLDLAREKGFKGLIAGSGETGLHFADYYKPSAVILDIGLPGIDGWSIMERLKSNASTRHIPVHFISAADKSRDAIKMGAIGYLTKPVTIEELETVFKRIEGLIAKRVWHLLVVEDDDISRKSIVELLQDKDKDVRIKAVGTGGEAYELLKTETYDCMVLDLGLGDMSGFDLLKRIRSEKNFDKIPVIIYTGKELSKEDETVLRKQADSIIIKGARSHERLLDETTLFLHRVETDLPEQKQKMIRTVYDKESVFKDKKVLIVDDDMRNVFAVSNILEEKGMEVLVGKTGKEGLECLNAHPDIDLVLMDIMMPEMDGYEAMGEIRKQERFRSLPIIALTAKAMTGERNKCLEAGASDYLAKPFDIEQMLSLMRVWLY